MSIFLGIIIFILLIALFTISSKFSKFKNNSAQEIFQIKQLELSNRQNILNQEINRIKQLEISNAQTALENWKKNELSTFENWRNSELNNFENWKKNELNFLSDQTAKNLFEAWKMAEEQGIRKDAIQRSISVTKGKITEHLIPFFPDFEFDPRDVRFLGSPFDLIIFDGLDEARDSDSEIRKIVFMEIKTGKASLSGIERKVRDCVNSGRVEYRLVRLNSVVAE